MSWKKKVTDYIIATFYFSNTCLNSVERISSNMRPAALIKLWNCEVIITITIITTIIIIIIIIIIVIIITFFNVGSTDIKFEENT